MTNLGIKVKGTEGQDKYRLYYPGNSLNGDNNSERLYYVGEYDGLSGYDILTIDWGANNAQTWKITENAENYRITLNGSLGLYASLIVKNVEEIRFKNGSWFAPILKTYLITTTATNINEGSILTTSVATTNVASGTTLYYSLSGTAITTADFSSGALTGSGAVGTDGKLSISHTIANDLTTEGIEILNIKLFSDSSRSTQVGSTASVSITDTSITPPTYTITPSATSINEGSTLTTSVATTNVASGTTLYYSLSGTGITTSDFSSGALTGSGSVGSNGSFSFSHTLANDLTTEGIETLDIKLFSDILRTIQVSSTASIGINDTSLGYSYFTAAINRALKDWNIFAVDSVVKAGYIVNQWFGIETPIALQTQDPTDTKLLDITTSSWAEKVKINRVAKASDNGDVIEGKQKETGSTDIVGSVLTGGKGNDRIQAMAGWDMVDGGEGDDLVKTGNGRDILTGGTGRDELWGGFGWNTYKGDKDGFSDLIVIKSDQHLPNPTIGNKSGNNSDGLKTDIIENLDSIDKLIIQGVSTNQITFANATAQGLTGIGIYSKGFIEALYTGGDLTIAQLTSMTTGDTSAAVMNNTLTSYGVW